MADPEPQNQPGNEKKPEPSQTRPEPKIRTMESDIAEFVKETKPSLIQIMTKQVEYRPEVPERERKKFPLSGVLLSVLALLLLLAAGWAGYNFLASRPGPAEEPAPEEKIPSSPISVEATQDITIRAGLFQLQGALNEAASLPERAGALKRLNVIIRNPDGSTHPLITKELFRLLDITPPSQILNSLEDTFFLYAYYDQGISRGVLALPSRDTGRTFAGMLGWENLLQRDLDILFFREKPPSVIAPFIDKTFRNTDYRILDIAEGFSMSYFIFEAKKLLVISASEEALQVVINRLFAAR